MVCSFAVAVVQPGPSLSQSIGGPPYPGAAASVPYVLSLDLGARSVLRLPDPAISDRPLLPGENSWLYMPLIWSWRQRLFFWGGGAVQVQNLALQWWLIRASPTCLCVCVSDWRCRCACIFPRWGTTTTKLGSDACQCSPAPSRHQQDGTLPRSVHRAILSHFVWAVESYNLWCGKGKVKGKPQAFHFHGKMYCFHILPACNSQ